MNVNKYRAGYRPQGNPEGKKKHWLQYSVYERAILRISKQAGSREQIVLMMLCEGHSTREISEAMGISKNTVTTHIANLTRKSGGMGILGIQARVIRNMRVLLNDDPLQHPDDLMLTGEEESA